MNLPRRAFLKTSSVFATALALPEFSISALGAEAALNHELPAGAAPAPVPFPHFPDRLHAFVWRNWTLVPLEKMAAVLDASPDQIRALGQSMGLPAPSPISAEQQRRSYITIIRRNWHLIPYEQLLQLLDWSAEHMAYMLREDDFLYIKLGSHKPKCAPLRYEKPSEDAAARAREIAATLKALAPDALIQTGTEPLFQFVTDLSAPPETKSPTRTATNPAPRFCYSYFALYGDPLLEPELDPYPEGYLQRLAATGVNGVWLQAVLQKLAPFPWISENSADREKRLKNLRTLAQRAARHGIGIYLYLNEPRTMPQSFFAKLPDLKGVSVGDYASLCTSHPDVRKALTDAVAQIVTFVPEIAGFFTITASENPTNCWSHGAGANCPRCGKRSAAEVIAEVNTVFYDGIQQAKKRVDTKASLIAWDWGWRDEWSEGIIQRLPTEVILQSVSEWSIPIKRGGIDSVVGEYSISTVGPGPRATRHWALARKRGLRTSAKIQAGNTWELSAVPYIPALENVALHAARLRDSGVDGLQLGWTLGGYPSPNLQTACDITIAPRPGDPANKISIEETVQRALDHVATTRFGPALAPAVVHAWKSFSTAFSEFPYHGGVVYNAPMQYGPSNLLWAEPTGYAATMVGFPYDDLEGWRQVYPPQVFIDQFTKIADGFDAAIAILKRAIAEVGSNLNPEFQKNLAGELSVATAASIHFRSTAHQARFVHLRNQLRAAKESATNESSSKIASLRDQIREILRAEIQLARQLHQIQSRDSRIGFEATNHYYYVPQDLLEKILNCEHLLKQLT